MRFLLLFFVSAFFAEPSFSGAVDRAIFERIASNEVDCSVKHSAEYSCALKIAGPVVCLKRSVKTQGEGARDFFNCLLNRPEDGRKEQNGACYDLLYKKLRSKSLIKGEARIMSPDQSGGFVVQKLSRRQYQVQIIFGQQSTIFTGTGCDQNGLCEAMSKQGMNRRQFFFPDGFDNPRTLEPGVDVVAAERKLVESIREGLGFCGDRTLQGSSSKESVSEIAQ